MDETSNDCEEDEENSNVQNMLLVPCDKEKEHLITNPPQLVFLMSMTGRQVSYKILFFQQCPIKSYFLQKMSYKSYFSRIDDKFFSGNGL